MKTKKLLSTIFLIVSLLTVNLATAGDSRSLEQTSDGGVKLTAGYRQAAFRGETVTFTHSVQNINDDNTNVTLSLSFVADDPTWVVSLTPSSVELDEGEEILVELTVRPPANAVENAVNQIAVIAMDGNPADKFTVVDTVQVLPRGDRTYFPIIEKDAMGAIVQLREIDNQNGNGEYVVRWQAIPGTTGYILQEATNASFTDARTAYSGSALFAVIEGKTTGNYYYRVRGSQSTGWSNIEPTTVIPYPGIFGVVTYNGTPISDIALNLQCYNGSSWYTADTATTGQYGIYVFDSAPTLDGTQYCYVRYGPNTEDTRYLYLWDNANIYYYISGTSTPGGSFDIADVVLQSPAETTTCMGYPITFQWTRRNASLNDSYELIVLDASSGGVVWRSGLLGDAAEYTMYSLPTGILSGVYYGWSVIVYEGDGAGVSYDERGIMFDGSGCRACLDIDNDTGQTMTFRIHGMAAKSIPTGQYPYECFSPGTYTYTADAWCGSSTADEYFPPGSSTLRFWCPDPACLYINNNTGGNITFQINGMESKTMPTGQNLYKCFSPGSYSYSASARCGSLTGSRYFSAGTNIIEFWCGMARILALRQSLELVQQDENGTSDLGSQYEPPVESKESSQPILRIQGLELQRRLMNERGIHH